MAEAQRTMKKHTLLIDARQSISASGIKRVDSFSPELITARTETGQLNVKGEGLYIESLNSETGDIFIKGKIIALSYSDSNPAASFLQRLFK